MSNSTSSFPQPDALQLPAWAANVAEIPLAPREVEPSAEDRRRGYANDPKVVRPILRGVLKLIEPCEAQKQEEGA